ncbi:MFS transporter [Burkholderia cenocepacia]|uniref:MFS transporter n=1 Tax=Burkholderia cenocepacia TaxID=95486 RepID=UPI000D0C1E8C|nr:MFS transporter [Burkholderia cenocepacia]MBR7965207.1 MFS transporter [Burkholderia cenocepacia]SOT41486.1 Major Facilitator Superfamily protein [Burkholderia cenocepacia]
MNPIRRPAAPRAADVAAPARHRLALPALCIAVLIAQIDTAIVNLATEPIGTAFGARVGALQWVIDAYNLAYAVLLLTGGLIGDLYGRRRAFVLGATVLSGASVVCALAPTLGVLIAGRALAGAGAALLIPASLAIVRVLWRHPAERARALGIWAACGGIAMIVGPTLGGVLIHALGWRSIFGVVIPFGIAAIALTSAVVPESADPRGRRFDPAAQVLGAIAIGCVVFATIDARHDPQRAALLIGTGAAAIALFVRIERRLGTAALVPLDLFANRAFRGMLVGNGAMTFGGYGMLFVLPLAWQSHHVLDASGASLALLPMSVPFALVSFGSGAVAARVGARTAGAGGVALIGLGLAAIGIGAAGSTNPHAPMLAWAEAGLALTGTGLGLAVGSLAATAVGAVDAARAGTAASLMNVTRMIGAVFGVALLGALYDACGGGASGLRVAMLTGSALQLAGAALAWRTAGTGTRAGAPRPIG